MTAPILTLAEVMALAGFTEGPWEIAKSLWYNDNNEREDRPQRFSLDEMYAEMGHVGPATVYGKEGDLVADDPDAKLIAAAPALHATCLHLHAEVARLTAELGKPIVGPWRRESFGNQVRWHASAGEGDRIAAIARVPGDWRGGWLTRGFWGTPKSSGPEAGDAGKRAADLALVAAGYRLVGGVFGEVSDGT